MHVGTRHGEKGQPIRGRPKHLRDRQRPSGLHRLAAGRHRVVQSGQFRKQERCAKIQVRT